MRLLTFQTQSFGWKTYSKTLEDVPDVTVDKRVEDALVVFMHIERRDEDEPQRALRYAAKHLKWLAKKQGITSIVLHSFAHLGGESSSAAFARDLIQDLSEKLSAVGYALHMTPFGYFCSWDIDVQGHSLAKVYKAF